LGVFASTSIYKPLIRRVSRLLRIAEPSEYLIVLYDLRFD